LLTKSPLGVPDALRQPLEVSPQVVFDGRRGRPQPLLLEPGSLANLVAEAVLLNCTRGFAELLRGFTLVVGHASGRLAQLPLHVPEPFEQLSLIVEHLAERLTSRRIGALPLAALGHVADVFRNLALLLGELCRVFFQALHRFLIHLVLLAREHLARFAQPVGRARAIRAARRTLLALLALLALLPLLALLAGLVGLLHIARRL
jgi:hypothetical protein